MNFCIAVTVVIAGTFPSREKAVHLEKCCFFAMLEIAVSRDNY